MILTDYLLSTPGIQWEIARQLGVNHATIRLPETEDFDFTDPAHWQTVYDRFRQYGLTPTVIEPIPNALHDHIKAGDDKRDESIEKLIRMLPIMESLDIRTVCANFMALIGWYRTSAEYPERGGAKVTAFDMADFTEKEGLAISQQQLWANLEYFLRAVMPEAEKHGIRIALHPDDPPVPRLGKVSRILVSRENIIKALNLVPSPNLGVTLCQGSYLAMGEDIYDTIECFLKMDKVFFVHFRDVAGKGEQFHETFHDNGPTDMARALRIYQRYGYHGPIRVDHVPTMAGDRDGQAGYQTTGRLFAVGYMKGLLDALGYSYI